MELAPFLPVRASLLCSGRPSRKSDQEPMKIRKPSVNSFLYTVVLFCVFSFKLILVGVGESGIRADDLFIFAAFVVLLFRGDIRKVERSRAVNIYLVFVLLNLISAVWNSAMGRISPFLSLLFAVRLLQYMVFYYLGYLIARSGRSLIRAMKWYLAIMVVVIPLQMKGLFPVFGAFSGIQSRAVGNTNGPYELAVVAAFLLCFLCYQLEGPMRAVVAMLLIVLSASRVTLVATIFSVAKVLFQRAKSKLKLAAICAVLLLLTGLSLAVFPMMLGASRSDVEVFKRLSSLTSTSIPEEAAYIYSVIPSYRTSSEYLEGEYLDSGDHAIGLEGVEGEVSGAIRLFRWTSLIKSALSRVDTTLIGLGPSFGSAAVDGYFVRVFIETGLLGMAAFIAFAVTLLRDRRASSWPFREYVFIVLASCCFIDIGVSYKPMLLLWLWHGVNQCQFGKEPHQ